MRSNVWTTMGLGLMLAGGGALAGATGFTPSPEPRRERLEQVRAREAEHDAAKKKGPSVAIVKDGKPNAVIVCIAGAPSRPSGDMPAAQELQTWIKLMSGAELPITENPALSGVNLYVGQAARDHGLDLADIESPSDEGFRVRSDGNKILIAGQSSSATFRAVARFLEEEFGCHWLAAPDWGMVYPAPHLYLSIRLAYDPRQDPWEIMADYWHHLYGPAAEAMEKYWMEIDAAFVNLHTEAGGVHSLHHVYTIERLERLDTFLTAAREVAAERPEVLDRIAVARRGFQRASFWRTYFDAMNRGDFEALRAIYDEWQAFLRESVALGNAHMFSLSGRMGLGATGFPQLADVVVPEDAPPNRIAAVLPDEWKTATRTEIDAAGVAGNPWDVDFDDTDWLTIKTFSDTRNAQGLPQYFGDIWYRTTWQTPPAEDDLLLYFVKADRRVTLYVDGQQINTEAVDAFRGTALDVTGHIQPGRQHQITVNVEHPAIAELFLGGLVHPVYLIEENDTRHATPDSINPKTVI